jgi:inward rectifier potassium channel
MATDKKDIKSTQDLGLGDRVIQENRTRFLNRDGTFNVHRKGVFERGSFSPYHAILQMTWPRFIGALLFTYLLTNTIFTGLYLLCGASAFPTLVGLPFLPRLGDIFYFSVHVITTIGESGLTPSNILSKILLSLEAMTGLLGFALAAGVMFARFSNPATKIIFSKKAVVAPYKDITAFMVRIVNGRSNELINVQATVTVAMADENGVRRFTQLSLEREMILVFPLNWTIVHPIDAESPLYGITTQEEFARRDPEFLVGISATDQDLDKTVYSRHSYIAKEIVVGKRFTNILERMDDGTIVVDPARIHEIEPA